jgi:membrane protein DedA with SNARE-associated domain
MRPLLHKVAITLAAYGPWGIFVLAAIDSLGVPLPAAIDLLVTGTAASNVNAPMHAYGAAGLAIVGSLVGNVALFHAARHGRRMFGERGPAPGSTRFEAWFYRYGLLTVFVPAVTPVAPLPLKVFVISAGALRTPFGKFLGVILVARTIRYLGLAWLGLQLGQNAPDFLRHNLVTMAAVALVLALMLVFLMRWNDGRRQTRAAL